MIKTITIRNYLGQSIELDLYNPMKSGFAVGDVTGLGSAKANVNITELATFDGGVASGARAQSRNIVMNLIFLDDPQNGRLIEDCRLESYKYFPTKREVTLTFKTDRRLCEITGIVEHNEPSIFDKNEGCQVSIICPDPYFYSIAGGGITRTIFYGAEPLFEFEFSNESTKKKLINIGSIVDRAERTITYTGDAEIGIKIQVHATGEVRGLKIYNISAREVMSINDEKLSEIVGSGIIAGDDIIINTIKKQKGIVFVRDGVEYNVLNALDTPISWFKLSKGNNIFVYTVTYGLSNTNLIIENRTIYEGV